MRNYKNIPYGPHLLAVDVDGYPAGAALCHKLVVCGKDGLNVRHTLGRHKKTAVVLVDCGFLCLVDATTIGTVKSTPAAKFEWIACPVALTQPLN